jgi:hypothetical protein
LPALALIYTGSLSNNYSGQQESQALIEANYWSSQPQLGRVNLHSLDRKSKCSVNYFVDMGVELGLSVSVIFTKLSITAAA